MAAMLLGVSGISFSKECGFGGFILEGFFSRLSDLWRFGRVVRVGRVGRVETVVRVADTPLSSDLIRTSIYDKYSGSMKITQHLDHICHCRTASGTNWWNRWTYQVFIMNTDFGP